MHSHWGFLEREKSIDRSHWRIFTKHVSSIDLIEHMWRHVCFLHAMCAYMQEDKCLQWPSKEVITLHMHNLYVHARIRTQVSISALTTEQTRVQCVKCLARD